MIVKDVLEAISVTRTFGGVHAVKSVDARIESGAIVALIGPNGAGKTTLLNCIAGTDRPTSGTVLMDGIDITKKRPNQRAVLGVRRTFQHARPFDSMTLVENTMTSLGSHVGYTTPEGILRLPRYRKGESAARTRAYNALERVGLSSMAERDPRELSAGLQRLVEVARAYAAEPRFLLLDEPTSGLDSSEADALFTLLREFREEGIGMIVVEHRIQTVAEIADQMIVMDQGRVVASGTPEDVRNADTVVAAYMGGA